MVIKKCPKCWIDSQGEVERCGDLSHPSLLCYECQRDELQDRLSLAEAANAELQARLDAVDTAAWDKLKAELKELKEVRKDDIEAYNEQAVEIEDLNESLTIAHMDGVHEGRKSKEAEIERFKTAIQQCLTGNAHLANGNNCTLAGLKQAMKA